MFKIKVDGRKMLKSFEQTELTAALIGTYSKRASDVRRSSTLFTRRTIRS